jgi:hypothetical protein
VTAALALILVVGPAGASVRAPKTLDAAIFQAGVVVAGDVGPGWIQSKQPTGNNNAVLRRIPACKQIAAQDSAVRAGVPSARSPEFSDPSSRNGETAVAGVVYAFKNARGAAQYLAAFTGQPALKCFDTVAQLEAGAQAHATTSRVQDLSRVGDESVIYESTLKGPSQQGPTVTLTTDTVAVRVGRAVVALSFINAGAQRLPQGTAIIDAVVGRLQPLRP